MAEPVDMPITGITIDPGLQPRVKGIDPDHVHTLEKAHEAWPPLIAVNTGTHVVLVDGYHRYAAAQNLGLRTVPVEIRTPPADGDLQALAFALNAVHGRPLTLTDRRQEAARLLQQHPEWADREVGRRCGLAQPTVAKVRGELERSAQIEQTDVRVGRGGYTYTVGTNPRQRPAGELPDEGIGERLGGTVGRMFTSEERQQQRRIVSYLKRLAVALEDGDDLEGWSTDEDAAEACRLVLGEEAAAELGERLGQRSRDVLLVAIALGYDVNEDAA